MSSFFRKTLSFFGLADEEDLEVEVEEDNRLPIRERREVPRDRMAETEKVAARKTQRKKVSLISSARDSRKSRVFVAEPAEFDEIQIIADNFKNDIPVIVNLQKVEPDVSKRIIDFCSGLTYALEGDIKKVAETAEQYLAMNVHLTDET